MKFFFDVWTEIHGMVEIEAEDTFEAWDKLEDKMWDVELTDEHSDREAVLTHVEEE